MNSPGSILHDSVVIYIKVDGFVCKLTLKARAAGILSSVVDVAAMRSCASPVAVWRMLLWVHDRRMQVRCEASCSGICGGFCRPMGEACSQEEAPRGQAVPLVTRSSVALEWSWAEGRVGRTLLERCVWPIIAFGFGCIVSAAGAIDVAQPCVYSMLRRAFLYLATRLRRRSRSVGVECRVAGGGLPPLPLRETSTF